MQSIVYKEIYQYWRSFFDLIIYLKIKVEYNDDIFVVKE